MFHIILVGILVGLTILKIIGVIHLGWPLVLVPVWIWLIAILIGVATMTLKLHGVLAWRWPLVMLPRWVWLVAILLGCVLPVYLAKS